MKWMVSKFLINTQRSDTLSLIDAFLHKHATGTQQCFTWIASAALVEVLAHPFADPLSYPGSLCSYHRLITNISVNKSRRMEWVEHISSMNEV
jgi:hypothetical protein